MKFLFFRVYKTQVFQPIFISDFFSPEFITPPPVCVLMTIFNMLNMHTEIIEGRT
ncbi:hypothetical protein Bealeia1_00992 [Candidatus Bealeia paramacronuclearis]|uniref:Uncharacterized protein n=1 Tax=Candidatus Bealeia paramacronuclearis TaxID=1921001 RepID=A0ABZ2C330_9PROT|nr:hypothetical protein [Candidatus Bealeia paramacronuclearis]